MQVGFIGAGNMAGALARGWGEPMLATDSGSGRARALAAEARGAKTVVSLLARTAQADVRAAYPDSQVFRVEPDTPAEVGPTAELLRRREGDSSGLRRWVASPGGTTARGLAALERGGVRKAFLDAMDEVVG